MTKSEKPSKKLIKSIEKFDIYREGKDIIAYDVSAKQEYSRMKLASIKGGIQGALFNFRNVRDFRGPKHIDYIKEVYTYDNGIKMVGVYSKPGGTLPIMRTSAERLYAIRVVINDGNIIRVTSPKMNYNQLTFQQARNMAWSYVYQKIGGKYGESYSEEAGREAFEDMKNKRIVSVSEGFVYIDKSGYTARNPEVSVI